jgi:hypothetical protein
MGNANDWPVFRASANANNNLLLPVFFIQPIATTID